MSQSIRGPNNYLAFPGATKAATSSISSSICLLLFSLSPKPKNKLIPVLIFLPPSTIRPILGYPEQLAIWFVYTYIDNHLLYLSAEYYHNLLLSNFCHFIIVQFLPMHKYNLHKWICQKYIYQKCICHKCIFITINLSSKTYLTLAIILMYFLLSILYLFLILSKIINI